MCQCYTIGGPFIGADPDCAVHGDDAQSRDRALDSRLDELHEEIALLRMEIGTLRDLLQARTVNPNS